MRKLLTRSRGRDQTSRQHGTDISSGWVFEGKQRKGKAKTGGNHSGTERGPGKTADHVEGQRVFVGPHRRCVLDYIWNWSVHVRLSAIESSELTRGLGVVAVGYSVLRMPSFLKTISPLLVLASITWTAWDPTYASLKRSQLQGRAVRQRGKKEYNVRIVLRGAS